MKNILMILLLISVAACSTDRLFSIDDKEPQKPVAGKDSTEKEPKVVFVATMPQELKKKSEVVMIKSFTDLPFITKNGNKIHLWPSDFRSLPDGKAVTFPFRLEVTELLSIKDIILNNKPTVSNGRLLSTDGQILVRAYKDDTPLSLNLSNTFYIEMKSMNKNLPDTEMKVFLAEEAQSDTTNWQLDTTNYQKGEAGCKRIKDRYYCGKLSAFDSVYIAMPSMLGWINIDKFADYTNTTSLRFKSDNELTNVHTYLFFPDLNSVVSVYYDKEFPLPVGVKARVISFSFTDDGTAYAYFEDIVIQPNLEVNIKLSKTTKEALLKELEKL